MAYDFAHKEVVLFGGSRKNLQVSADTWVWDGTNWIQKFPATSPPAQLRQAMAYDAAHQQIVLFGGGRPQTNDTWVWDGTTWTQMFPSSKPSARESPALVYNPARGNTVLFGGMYTIIPLGDTWVWDGSNWTQVFPTTSPEERFAAGIAYDLSKAEAILFGGASTAGNDTWAWDSLGSYEDLYDFDYTHGSSPEEPGLLAQGRDGDLYGTTTVGGDFGGGVVFKIAPPGPLTIVYNLDAAVSGNYPQSGLTLGTDGNFYGTAAEGIGGPGPPGDSMCGTIFKTTPAGKLTLLYQFQGGADGCSPDASVIRAANGSFYGTTITFDGHPTASGIAYKITSSGVFKPLASLPGGSDAPLLQGKDGNFYGVTETGGTFDAGTVFRMSGTGIVKVLYSFDGTLGANPFGGLVQSTDGNFYGTTNKGGILGGGTVFKITPAGAITVLHEFDATNPAGGYSIYTGLLEATDGNFYGVASSGGVGGCCGGGVIFRITHAGIYTVLYNFDDVHGLVPLSTPMQHTNGKIYSTAREGGQNLNGVVYSLDVGLQPFVSLLTTSGKAGQQIQILGQGFIGTTDVSFGTGSATFTVISDTYITAVVPATGTTGYVTVTTPSGILTSSKIFKVIPVIKSFTPTNGPVGTQVTITGSGFIGATKVTFGGVKATSYTVDSGTQITAMVPVGAKTGKIAVTTPGGTAMSATGFTVTP